MKRHQKICKGQTKYRFPGGFYSTPKTIFDKLEQHGIVVPEEDRHFEWFLVYDFEAIRQKSIEPSSERLKWTHQHLPISVSICSNVEDYTKPRCIIDSEVDSLIRQMVDYMTQIGHQSYQLALDKFSAVFEALDNDIQHVDGPLELDVVMEDEEWLEERKKMHDHLEELKKELDAYCLQLLCLGFNSAKYDLYLMKTHIPKHLDMHDGQKVFTIKRNNQYACLSIERFKILDITQYLPAGTKYDSFLKAYDVPVSKGFFPYEWFADVLKLENQSLPPHESLYSSLKQTNISLQEYEFCQRVWAEQRMRTFKDFLEWYSNLDVESFVMAVERLRGYYFERRIDILKTSVSVPGLARQMLFECGRKDGASFSLFDEANSDLYKTIKRNIIGGPSIIFHRFREKHKTFLRGNPEKSRQNILGFDANVQYLYCMDQPMPTGPFVRRRLEDGFHPKKRD